MTLKIMSTTDVHGFLDKGLAQVATLRGKMQADLLIDNGDFFVGSPFATYGRFKHELSPLVSIANQIAYDVMVPGNHDLDFGLAWLKQQVSGLKADYVCANLVDLEDNLVFQAYTILERQGQKIAVIGLMTYALSQLMPERNLGQVKVISPFKALEAVLPEIEADVIVVAYHGGLTKDPVTGHPWHYPSLEDQAYELMTTFPQIDSLICGHQHFVNSGVSEDSGTALVQSGSFGRFIAYQAFDKGEVIDNRIIELDESFFQHPWEDDYQSWLKEKIDIEAVYQFIEDFYPGYDFYSLDFQAETIAELAQVLSTPFPLGEYVLSGSDLKELSLALQSEEIENKTFKVLASPNKLPLNRLRKQFLVNLFDEFILANYL